MPITPQFKISQTDTTVQIDIAVPHIRVHPEQTQAVLVDRSVLHFCSPPVYLLVLNFAPHKFVEDDELTAVYQNEHVMITLQKTVPENYANLDLVGKLKQPKVSPKKSTTARWLLQEIKDKEDVGESVTKDDAAANDKEKDTAQSGLYGFARLFRNIFGELNGDGVANELLEVSVEESILVDPEAFHSNLSKQKQTLEDAKFDPGRYLGDFFGADVDYLYNCAISMVPHWQTDNSNDGGSSNSVLSQDEQNQLMSIPYPLLPKILPETVPYGVLDILFAYVYDHVLTSGEATVESAWTISTLSASLSTLTEFHSTKSVVVSSLRRCLIYPYVRHFGFGIKVWTHVAKILRCDIRVAIRSFLQIHQILDHSELYYLGNKLYVDPYLRYIQDCTPILSFLADEIELVLQSPTLKEELGLNLVSLEAKAVGATVDADDSEEDSPSDNDSSSSSGDDDSSSTCTESDSFVGETIELCEGLLELDIGASTELHQVHEPSSARILIQELD